MLEENGHIQEAKEGKEASSQRFIGQENHAIKRMHMQCTYYHKQGHLAATCWTLNPTMLPPKLKKLEREDGRNGNEVSMDDVSQDDSHVDADVQTKEKHLNWIGKKLLEFFSN